ncbi:unnamed protein product [Polarella glacialis]|uniref:J domain-containing protein n=1 Tax=Polarella glacialis TaxID=89957 RepID=A0A813JHA7_POLGL|nr:unnamed protein product [Polarella glacialis]|mmetsp:Transcript_39638/g.64073  ORF Transcript_39638/g.64073 Transcript_39638/m.64073 type:complete len:168 (-) Transcript_39638:146-649(-)
MASDESASSSSSEVLAEQVLGVQVGASDAEIRRAFLALARIHHPDKSSDPEAADRFRQLHDAYEELLAPPRCGKGSGSQHDMDGKEKHTASDETCSFCQRVPNEEERFVYWEGMWFCYACWGPFSRGENMPRQARQPRLADGKKIRALEMGTHESPQQQRQGQKRQR